MGNVKIKEMTTATYVVDNSMDESRGYDISASVTVSGGNIEKIEAGEVSETHGGVMANFSVYNNNLSLCFTGKETEDVQVALLTEIHRFIDSVTDTFKN